MVAGNGEAFPGKLEGPEAFWIFDVGAERLETGAEGVLIKKPEGLSEGALPRIPVSLRIS